jgi:hypothetical protein
MEIHMSEFCDRALDKKSSSFAWPFQTKKQAPVSF